MGSVLESWWLKFPENSLKTCWWVLNKNKWWIFINRDYDQFLSKVVRMGHTPPSPKKPRDGWMPVVNSRKGGLPFATLKTIGPKQSTSKTTITHRKSPTKPKALSVLRPTATSFVPTAVQLRARKKILTITPPLPEEVYWLVRKIENIVKSKIF